MVDTSEKFRWLVRLGFAARGVVYVLIGYLFLIGDSRAPEGGGGPQSAFNWLQEIPGGTAVLYLAALGLAGYALFRGASALFDIDRHGRDAEAIAKRAGHAASALGHVAMAYTAVQFAHRAGADGEAASREAASTLLAVPFGSVILGLVGLGFFGAAIAQAKKAYTGHFMRRVSSQAPGFVEHLGRAGYGARAVVFAIIGWSLAKSAWFDSGDHVKNLGGAIASLGEHGWALVLVALGLLVFGLFSFLLARYRIIPDLDRR